MTLRKAIGYMLIASPFGAVFAIEAYTMSISVALGCFALTSLVLAIIYMGMSLVSWEDK